jgi:hypothetical protein
VEGNEVQLQRIVRAAALAPALAAVVSDPASGQPISISFTAAVSKTARGMRGLVR